MRLYLSHRMLNWFYSINREDKTMFRKAKLDEIIALAQQVESAYKGVLVSAETAFTTYHTTIKNLDAALTFSQSKKIGNYLANAEKELNNAKTALDEFTATVTIVRETPTLCLKGLETAKKKLEKEIQSLKVDCEGFKRDFKEACDDLDDFWKNHACLRELDKSLLADKKGLLGGILRFIDEHTDRIDKSEEPFFTLQITYLKSNFTILVMQLMFPHQILKDLLK